MIHEVLTALRARRGGAGPDERKGHRGAHWRSHVHREPEPACPCRPNGYLPIDDLSDPVRGTHGKNARDHPDRLGDGAHRCPTQRHAHALGPGPVRRPGNRRIGHEPHARPPCPTSWNWTSTWTTKASGPPENPFTPETRGRSIHGSGPVPRSPPPGLPAPRRPGCADRTGNRHRRGRAGCR